MTEFIINSYQLEQLIEGIEHKTGREINRVVCNDKELPIIVRCRDCKHHTYTTWHRCDLHSIAHEVEPDGFCYWGERKVAE